MSSQNRCKWTVGRCFMAIAIVLLAVATARPDEKDKDKDKDKKNSSKPAASGKASKGTSGAGGHAATPTATGHPAGGQTVTPSGTPHPTGHSLPPPPNHPYPPPGYHPAPNAFRTIHTGNGNEVHLRPGGAPRDVHLANRGIMVHHSLSGNRVVVVDRADRSRVVAVRGSVSYVQRPYAFRGHEYGHRTYYYHGRVYDRFYRVYPYHGVFLNVYAPSYYYRPAFYGWAYNPWAVPVPYVWGWRMSPWYGYYGSYFRPYRVYPSASFWLTDYLVSASLEADYEARMQAHASAPPPDAAPLSPEVKDQIAAEVQRQIALENTEAQAAAQNAETDPASSGIQRLMSDNAPHVFVAGRDLDLTDASGAECPISEGDALQLTAAPPAEATSATLAVLSSKGGTECRPGTQVTVEMADLQDMQNHMREVIDQGMAELQSKRGKGGLPAPPASANGAPVQAPFAQSAPPPEANVAAEINQQTQEADQAEKEALNGVPADSSAPPAAPSGPALGQSVDEVVAALGQPTRVIELGPKKIYVYQDIRVTFTGGKVTGITAVE